MVSIKAKPAKIVDKKPTKISGIKKIKKDKKSALKPVKPELRDAIINAPKVSKMQKPVKVKHLVPTKHVAPKAAIINAPEVSKKQKPMKVKPIVPSNHVVPKAVNVDAPEVSKTQKRKKVKHVIPSKHVATKAAIIEAAELSKKQKPKKVKYMLPSKHVTQDLVESCIKALHVLDTRQKTEKTQILADETPIFAEIHLLKIQSAKGNVKFVLPHSTVAVTGEVCLITPDLKKGKRADHEPTVDKWEEILSKAGVKNVKTILPMRQLRVEYDQYELKRRLLTQHDFIMVDTRILSHVSHILGNMFVKKHNMLIPVRIDEKKDVKKQIDIGLRTAMLRMGQGETTTILVGHTAMPQKDVQENVLALVKQLNEKFPGGEKNIRSISLKLPLSLSLPIYVTLRPSSTITAPKLKHKKPKDYIDVVDELSTYPGSSVRVAPGGTVIFKKLTDDLSDEEAMDQEESDAVLSEKEEEKD